jgi:hypothetical protein
VRPRGAVFLRFGSFDGDYLIDRFGNILSVLRKPDGTIIEDRRSADGRQVEWAVPPLPGLLPAIPELAGPFSLGGDSYLPLRLLQGSPCGKVFSGLALSDAAEVLIKVTPRGMNSGLFGASEVERRDAEHRVLQALKGSGLAPQPIEYHKDSDFSVLVMEHVEGDAFSDLDTEHQISSLPKLASAISELHAAGFVHNDIKLANAIVTRTRVRLVDFELAAQVGSELLVPAGTHGYMPPEIEARVDGARDMYALGVCVAHVYLGFDPSGLPVGGGRLVGLLALFGYERVAAIARKLLDAQPSRRPCAKTAVQMLEDLAGTMSGAGRRHRVRDSCRRHLEASWCLRAAREAGLATRKFKRNTKSGLLWKARSYENAGSAESINIGSAGVILGLASIDRACGSCLFSDDINGGAKWLASQDPYQEAHGLFTGNAGVAVALAVAGRRLDRPEWIDAARMRIAKALSVEHDFDLFSGAAGVLWAACLLSEILEDRSFCEMARRCASEIIRRCELRDDLCVWRPVKPSDPPLTGAAHGSAGIALALATWARMAGAPEGLDLALETFERTFRNGRLMGGSMLRRTVGTPDSAVSSAPVLQWCHGIAGYLWSMLLAAGDHPRLAPAIDWSLERCAAANWSGSPVYCHGTAGELELWRLIGKYPRLARGAAARADRAARGLRFQLRREGGLCIWGAEDPKIVTPDLWVGFLGPATALALHALRASEPLLTGAWLRSCASTKQ